MPRFLSPIWKRWTTKSTPKLSTSPDEPSPKQPELSNPTATTSEVLILSTSHLTTSRPAECFTDPTMGNCTWHSILSAPSTRSDTFTVGIGVCEPETGTLAMHRHKDAEFYYVLSGSGVVRIEGQDHSVTVGDVVFIPGDAEHGVFNHGSEAFRWLYCFGVGSFHDVIYRFTEVKRSGKDVEV